MRIHSRAYQKSYEVGQTVLLVVVFFVVLTVVITSMFATAGVTQAKIGRDAVLSQRAFFGSEAGLEEVANRIKGGAVYDASFILNGSATEVQIVTTSDERGDYYAVTSYDNAVVRRSNFFINTPGNVMLTHDLQAGYSGIDLEESAEIHGSIFSGGPIHRIQSGSNKNKIVLRTDADPIKNGKLQVAKPRQGSDPEATHRPDINGATAGLGYGVAADGDTGAGTCSSPCVALQLRDTDNRDNLGQQFTVERIGLPEKVGVYMRKIGNGGTNFKIKIVGSTAGTSGERPNSAVEYASTNEIDRATEISTAWTWEEFTFTSGVTLYPDTLYWLVFDPVLGCGASCSNSYEVGGTAPGYAPQSITSTYVYEAKYGASISTSNWCRWQGCANPTTERDLIFQVFVGSGKNSIKGLDVSANGSPGVCSGAHEAWVDVITDSNVYVKSHFFSATGGNSGSPCAGSESGWTNTIDPPSLPMSDAPGGLIDQLIATTQGQQCTTAAQGCSDIAPYNFIKNQSSPDKTLPAISTTPPPPATNELWDIYIPGKLEVTNRNLIVKGNVYVYGDLSFDGGTNPANCNIYLDPGLGAKANRAIIVRGKVYIKNCNVGGVPGDTLSHLLIVSLSNSLAVNEPAIHLDNSASVDMVFALYGLLRMTNSSDVNAIYGEKIRLEGNTVVTSLAEGPGEFLFPTSQTVREPRGWGEAP